MMGKHADNNYLECMLAREHLVEIAHGLQQVIEASEKDNQELKRESLQDTANDRTTFKSSSGLYIFYTITKVPEGYIHHYSISDQERRKTFTTHSVLGTLTLYLLILQGVGNPEAAHFMRSQQNVYHAEFGVNEDMEQKFRESPIEIPSPEQAADIMMRCMVYVVHQNRIQFEPLETWRQK